MSRRRKRGYKEVLKAILTLLPKTKVQGFVADFQSGLWQAMKSVFPEKAIQGCAFHWAQAVWRKVQEMGLQAAYNQRDTVFKFIRKLLVLPFLPPEDITAAFEKLKDKATQPKLQELTTYINDTWMTSYVWMVEHWSVFMTATRTNNNVEGWHNRLNTKATHAQLPFYILVPKLLKEAKLIPIQCKMVSEGKLQRTQRRQTRQIQGHIFPLWDQYIAAELTASQLLRKCANIYSHPTVSALDKEPLKYLTLFTNVCQHL